MNVILYKMNDGKIQKSINSEINGFYIYVYLDPTVSDNYVYDNYKFPNKPIYVGKGTGSRYKHHCTKNRIEGDTNPMKKSIFKNFLKKKINPICVILEDNLIESDSYILEDYYINLISKRKDGGTLLNIKDGGNGFTSEFAIKTWENTEIRIKRTEGIKKYWESLSPDGRKEISESKMGCGNGFYGKNHTEKWKKEKSKKMLGKNNPNFGNKGKKNQLFGKKHTKEMNENKSKSLKKYYESLSPEERSKNIGNSKTNESDVIKMRMFYKENSDELSNSEITKILSEKFNMTYISVYRIIMYKTWKYVKIS